MISDLEDRGEMGDAKIRESDFHDEERLRPPRDSVMNKMNIKLINAANSTATNLTSGAD